MVGKLPEPNIEDLTASGFSVVRAQGLDEAATALEDRPFASVLVDHGLGVACLQSILARAARSRPAVPVVVFGATNELQDVVDAMHKGAVDFVPLPTTGKNLAGRLSNISLPAAVQSGSGGAPFENLGLIGASPAMARVHASISRIARYKANVLVLGESGTGKELIARALHATGPRRSGVFVPLNCATLGREILENELFGHERGAFTGANERKKGLFEVADRGTLFLDEIGELDLSTQAKLLRVLERNEFRRVGGTSKLKVDLSLIAATNRDLEEAIAAKRFRDDLYYRLKVVTIVVPPLRERREDIPVLIEAFIRDFNARNEGKIRGLAPPALRRLMEYDWPGNVRELKNAIESAAVLCAGETIELADLDVVARRHTGPASARSLPPPSPAATDVDTITLPLDTPLAEVERRFIEAQLRRSPTKTRAAAVLGIGLRTLYTKIEQLGLDPRLPLRSRGR